MAHFVAADVVVAILSKGVVGKKRRTYGTITLATTSATYDNPGGIYLPALTSFGFLKSIDNIFLSKDLSTAGTLVSDTSIFKYDKTLHTIRVFRSAAHTPTGSISAPTFTGVSASVAGSVTAPTFTGVAMTTWGTPTGSVSQPAFAGVSITPTGSVSAPTFTAVAIAQAGLAELTDTTLLGGTSLVLYFDAIGV